MVEPNPQFQSLGPELDRILIGLQSGGTKERMAAERCLDNAGPHAIGPLLEAFAASWRQSRLAAKDRYQHNQLSTFFVLIAFAIPFLPVISRLSSNIFLLLSVLLAVLCLFFRVLDMIRGFGSLSGVMRTWQFEDSRTHALMIALLYLLRRWSASGREPLNSAQRTGLACVLGSCALSESTYYDGPVAADILRELRQMRDTRALALVEILADPRIEHQLHPLVYKAARECVHFLREQVRRERVGDLLLRPASAPDEPTRVLLRPAENSVDSDRRQLLRPALTAASQSENDPR